VQVDHIKPTLRPPGTTRKRWKLEYDELFSSFAFKFNLRCYIMANHAAAAPGGRGGGGGPPVDQPAASLQSVLASISGEMARLAVGPGAAGGGGPAAGAGARPSPVALVAAAAGAAGAAGGGGGARNGGFVVLPAGGGAESLGSLLRIERADGRGGGGGGGGVGDPGAPRRGLSVGDARAATWADVGAPGGVPASTTVLRAAVNAFEAGAYTRPLLSST